MSSADTLLTLGLLISVAIALHDLARRRKRIRKEKTR